MNVSENIHYALHSMELLRRPTEKMFPRSAIRKSCVPPEKLAYFRSQTLSIS